MALFGTLFITINAITLLILFYNYYFKRRNLPPGPTPVPIFGNMLEILRNPSGEKKHLEWSRKYGPVYTFWMAENPVVCVANMDIMMNVFVKDADSCIDRYYNVGVDRVTKGAAAGLVFVDGELWKEQRRFALHVFRDFGVGKNVMQEKILIELLSRMEKINDDLESDPDQEYDLPAVVDIAIGSIIAALMFGRRFDGDTTNRFYQLKNYTNGWLRATTHPGLHFYQSMSPLLAPIMIHIPLLGEPIRALRDLNDNIFEYLDEEIAEHAANADPSAPPTDYCEAYWREMQHRKLNDDNSKHHYFTMHQLRCACLDLWIAGQETTSNTIAWGLAYLLYNPHVTKKVCEELDTVIGSTERMITVSDRPKLHYMNALISEIQRVANLLPMNVLHKTGRDITINGYFIPKGTTIIPQVSVPMCDDKVKN